MDKEEMIFQMYKDESMGCNKFRKICDNKFDLDKQTITKIYVRINNYQLERYGHRVCNTIERMTRESCLKKARLRCQCNYQKYRTGE